MHATLTILGIVSVAETASYVSGTKAKRELEGIYIMRQCKLKVVCERGGGGTIAVSQLLQIALP